MGNNKDDNTIVTEFNQIIDIKAEELSQSQSKDIEENELNNTNSICEENALVREIKKFMDSEEKESIQPIVCEEEESNQIIDKEEEKPVANGIGSESANVLDSLENILSRKSESRMSVKKRKQKNSIKSSDQLPDLIDSEEKSICESRPKSKEVFDFYMNSIDGDTAASEPQVPTENKILDKTGSTERSKTDEQIVIENLLNAVPKDLTRCDRLSEENSVKENGHSITENGTTESEFENLDDVETCKVSSTCTSGASTLRRSWKKQNSKKKRKSQHIL